MEADIENEIIEIENALEGISQLCQFYYDNTHEVGFYKVKSLVDSVDARLMAFRDNQ